MGLFACGEEAPDSQTQSAFSGEVGVPDSMTIPRMLESDARFSTLRAALDSTGLDSLLATDGPFTIFAPPNEAFEALPPGTMDVLLSEETERLRTILTQHVVAERLSLEPASLPQQIVTMAGDTLAFARTDDGISVDEIPIVDTNIEASNGLLHVLDAVFPPPSTENRP